MHCKVAPSSVIPDFCELLRWQIASMDKVKRNSTSPSVILPEYKWWTLSDDYLLLFVKALKINLFIIYQIPFILQEKCKFSNPIRFYDDVNEVWYPLNR